MINKADLVKILGVKEDYIYQKEHSITLNFEFMSILQKDSSKNKPLQNLSGAIVYHYELRINSYNYEFKSFTELLKKNFVDIQEMLQSSFSNKDTVYPFEIYIVDQKNNRQKIQI